MSATDARAAEKCWQGHHALRSAGAQIHYIDTAVYSYANKSCC